MAEEVADPLHNGRYRLRAVLGVGGMATVYRAWDDLLQVERAIKVLLPELSQRRSIRERFLTEARTMARLAHPHLVTVHDIGQDGERVFMVMEMVPGGSVMDRIDEKGPIEPDAACTLLMEGLEGLAVAHAAGVVHRDVKPHNLLVDADGAVRLTDFGIAAATDRTASMTRTGTVMGTWAYMAPEQRADAKRADIRADIYSMGASLFTMLTGREPFDLYVDQVARNLHKEMPEALADVVRKATRWEPELRYLSADEMRAAVGEAQQRLRAPAPDPLLGGATLIWTRGPPGGPSASPSPAPPAAASAPALTPSAAPLSVAPLSAAPLSAAPLSVGALPPAPPPPPPLPPARPAPPAAEPALPPVFPSPSPEEPTIAAGLRDAGPAPAGRRWAPALGVLLLGLIVAAVLWLQRGPAPTEPAAPTDGAPPEVDEGLPAAPGPARRKDGPEPGAPEPEPAPAPATGPAPTSPAPAARPAPETAPPADPPTAAPVPPAAAAAGPPGRLVLNSHPYSIVTIDGLELGGTPIRGYEASPGKHTIVFRTPDGQEARREVQVVSGESSTLCWDIAEGRRCD